MPARSSVMTDGAGLASFSGARTDFGSLEDATASPSDPGALIEAQLARLGLRDAAAGGHTVREPDVPADGRATADDDAPEDRRSGVDDDVVLDDRMAVDPLDWGALFVEREALRSQGHALI